MWVIYHASSCNHFGNGFISDRWLECGSCVFIFRAITAVMPQNRANGFDVGHFVSSFRTLRNHVYDELGLNVGRFCYSLWKVLLVVSRHRCEPLAAHCDWLNASQRFSCGSFFF